MTDNGSNEITRREFLAVSAAAVIVTPAGRVGAQVNGKPWYTVMRCCGQINTNGWPGADALTARRDLALSGK